jgi:hypothetical protein
MPARLSSALNINSDGRTQAHVPLATQRGGATVSRASRPAVTSQPPPEASVARGRGVLSAPIHPLTSNILQRGRGFSVAGGTYHRHAPAPGLPTESPCVPES